MSEPIYRRTSDIPGLTESIERHGRAGEGKVVAEIVAALKRMGYGLPPEGGPRGYYLLAGQRNTRHSGSNSGVPDVLVLAKSWTLPVEVKAREKDARISPTQYAMWKRGCLHIVNSAEQVENLIDRMEEAL